MKKFIKLILTLAVVLTILIFTACGDGGQNNISMVPRSTPSPAMTPPVPAAQAGDMYSMRQQFGMQADGMQPNSDSWSLSMAVSEAEMFETAAAFDSAGSFRLDSSADTTDWQDVAGQSTRHIIQTGHVTLESEYTDFHDAVAQLRTLAPAADGYIESEMLTGTGVRRFTIVLRIPTDQFDDVMAHVAKIANVTEVHQSAEDVTAQFYDTISRLETREIEEERILVLIEEATNIHDILALETRLSNVRQVMESYRAQLNNMAGRIRYSTIHVTLTSLPEDWVPAAMTPLGDRMGEAFGDSVGGTVAVMQDIVVFLAGAIIPLVIFGLIGLVGYSVFKVVYKKYRKPVPQI